MVALVDAVREATRSAPVNIEGLIEALGIKLVRKAKLDPEIGGQITYEDGKYEIAVNGGDNYFRRRFTMAHELGHYIYHRDLIGAGVDDNRAYRSTNAGNFFNKNITAEHETEANKFAASLLMPAKLVTSEHKKHAGNLAALSKEFLVSTEAMRYRLQSLDLALGQ